MMVAIFVTFLGFVVENIWLAVTKGYMDNRNMCLPFLMGYGMSMLLIFLILGTPEKTCHFYWWDYSPIPFHITRYTSIPTSTMLSVAITFFMDVVLKPLYNFFQRWNSGFLKTTVVVLLLLMTGDFVYNAYKMYKAQGMVRRWRISVGIIGMIRRKRYGL